MGNELRELIKLGATRFDCAGQSPREVYFTPENWQKFVSGLEAALNQPAPAALHMIDGKFGISNGGRLVKASTGEAIPDWEPVHVMRARDRLSLPLLRQYREISIADSCNDYHLQMIDVQIARFEKFEAEHPEWMKQPGITRGGVFKPAAAPASSAPSADYIPPPRSFDVTHDLQDAPDGAEVCIRYKRVGMSWEQIAVEAAPPDEAKAEHPTAHVPDNSTYLGGRIAEQGPAWDARAKEVLLRLALLFTSDGPGILAGDNVGEGMTVRVGDIRDARGLVGLPRGMTFDELKAKRTECGWSAYQAGRESK